MTTPLPARARAIVEQRECPCSECRDALTELITELCEQVRAEERERCADEFADILCRAGFFHTAEAARAVAAEARLATAEQSLLEANVKLAADDVAFEKLRAQLAAARAQLQDALAALEDIANRRLDEAEW